MYYSDPWVHHFSLNICCWVWNWLWWKHLPVGEMSTCVDYMHVSTVTSVCPGFLNGVIDVLKFLLKKMFMRTISLELVGRRRGDLSRKVSSWWRTLHQRSQNLVTWCWTCIHWHFDKGKREYCGKSVRHVWNVRMIMVRWKSQWQSLWYCFPCQLQKKSDFKGGEDLMKAARLYQTSIKCPWLERWMDGPGHHVVCRLYKCYRNILCPLRHRFIGTTQHLIKSGSNRTLGSLNQGKRGWKIGMCTERCVSMWYDGTWVMTSTIVHGKACMGFSAMVNLYIWEWF